LGQRLGHRVSADAVHGIGDSWLHLHAIAERDFRQLGRLERLGDVDAVRIPLFSEDASELQGLARIAALL
jgi:hypothetical protein